MSNISQDDGKKISSISYMNKHIKRPYAKKYYEIQTTIFKVLIFFTPLIFVANTNEIFEFPKMYFVYFLGGAAIWLFVLKKSLNNEQVKWPHPFINLFVLSYFISTLLSSHVYTSIWGYYTRFNGGLISVLIFYGLYIVWINDFDSYQIEGFADIILNAAVVSAIYGILQHYQLIIDVWKGNPAERVFSTLGQPNWYAAFLAMVSPTLLGHMFRVNEKPGEFDGFANVMWWISYILIFMALWFTYSISGLLGFAFGVLFFLIFNRSVMSKRFSGLLVMFVLTTALAMFNLGIFDEKLQDVYTDIKRLYKPVVEFQIITGSNQTAHAQTKVVIDTSTISKEVEEELENLISDPGFIRSGLWKGTIELYKSSPKIMLVGAGPETFAYEFQEFRPKELNYSSEWDFVFNKPHNYYLEIPVGLGAVGFIFYLMVVAKSINSKNGRFVPGLVAFYVSNFFGWPTVATALLFWLFLAGIEQSD